MLLNIPLLPPIDISLIKFRFFFDVVPLTDENALLPPRSDLLYFLAVVILLFTTLLFTAAEPLGINSAAR